MNNLDNKKKKRLQIAFALALLILITIFFSNSKSELLEDGAEVKPRSELTYYLHVYYDGVDRNGEQSTDTKLSKVNSGTIIVEDKIPDGLDFIGFVTTPNGTIGAITRDEKDTCPGKVIDDTNEPTPTEGVWNDTHTEFTYHGLHYNTETRTVSFQVKYLQAGCKLTIGVITKTPLIDDPDTPIVETRRDFYNFSTARERTLNKKSNTVHVYMGTANNALQNVSYEYTGDVPENAPELPETTSYAPGASVGVAANAKMEGYTFSGWTTEDAAINNNSFYMPTQDVVLKGSFSRTNDYKVTYNLTGDTPEDYSLPNEVRYYPETVVELDSLEEGDLLNGYRFLGWTSEDVEITEDRDFTMPEKDVVITGSFEEEKYQVSYQFGGNAPPNAESLLPETKAYKPGETVEINKNVTEPSGYQFMGWYEEDEFEMPEEDVVILGEWKASPGKIVLVISSTSNSYKYSYAYTEKAEYLLRIKNTNAYRVNDIMIKGSLEDIIFDDSNAKVQLLSDHIASISYLDPNELIEIPVSYIIKKTDMNDLTSKVEIIGASTEDGYELPDKNYSSSYTIYVQKPIKICTVVNGFNSGNIFQYAITYDSLYRYDTTMKANKCKTIYVDSSAPHYIIDAVIPQEYTVTNIKFNNENRGSSYYTMVDMSTADEKTVTFYYSFVKQAFIHSSGHINNEVPFQGVGG